MSLRPDRGPSDSCDKSGLMSEPWPFEKGMAGNHSPFEISNVGQRLVPLGLRRFPLCHTPAARRWIPKGRKRAMAGNLKESAIGRSADAPKRREPSRNRSLGRSFPSTLIRKERPKRASRQFFGPQSGGVCTAILGRANPTQDSARNTAIYYLC